MSVTENIYTTAKIIKGVQWLGSPIPNVVYASSGLAKTPTANAIFNTFPWMSMITASVDLVANIAFFVKGENSFDYPRNEVFYYGLINAFTIESGIEAIEKSTYVPDLSTFFFRLAILNFMGALPSLIKLVHNFKQMPYPEEELVVMNLPYSILTGAGYLALAFGYQSLGCGVLVGLNGIITIVESLNLSFSEDFRKHIHLIFFKLSDTPSGKNEYSVNKSATHSPGI